MTPRPRTPRSSAPAAGPAASIAAEVRAACDALQRAVAAGKAVRDDVRLEVAVDDLGVIVSDLALVDRDLEENGR